MSAGRRRRTTPRCHPGACSSSTSSRSTGSRSLALLEQLGHEVVEAEDGREALDAARGDPGAIDLVLLDVVMPEHRRLRDPRGHEGATRSSPRSRSSSSPAWTTSTGWSAASRWAPSTTCPRPIEPALLEARVGACLADKRLRDENARLLDTVERQRQELARFLSPQVAALVSSPDGRGAPRRPSARGDGRVLRPPRLHGLRRDRRARGAARRPARVPRRDGRPDRRARGHARALRRRRHAHLLQRPGRPGRPRAAGRPDGGRHARRRRASCAAGWASAATSSGSASGSRPGSRPRAASATKAATTTRRSATRW